MKPLQLTLDFDMSDPNDMAKVHSITAILNGGSAPAPTGKKAPAAPKAPKAAAGKKASAAPKAPTAPKTPASDIPSATELAAIKTEVGSLITEAVAAENPKSAANSALIGAELQRLGAAKVSMLSPDKLPGLRDFLVDNVE